MSDPVDDQDALCQEVAGTSAALIVVVTVSTRTVGPPRHSPLPVTAWRGSTSAPCSPLDLPLGLYPLKECAQDTAGSLCR